MKGGVSFRSAAKSYAYWGGNLWHSVGPRGRRGRTRLVSWCSSGRTLFQKRWHMWFYCADGTLRAVVSTKRLNDNARGNKNFDN